MFPLTPGAGEGGMLLVRHIGSTRIFSAEFICRARFFPCIGTEDEDTGRRVAEAFASGAHDSVRSLRLDPEQPDDSAWVYGRGWWLSTNAAPPIPSTHVI